MTDLQATLEALDKAAGPSHAIGVHVGMSDMPEGMRDFLTSLVDAYRANPLVAAPTGDAVEEAVDEAIEETRHEMDNYLPKPGEGWETCFYRRLKKNLLAAITGKATT